MRKYSATRSMSQAPQGAADAGPRQRSESRTRDHLDALLAQQCPLFGPQAKRLAQGVLGQGRLRPEPEGHEDGQAPEALPARQRRQPRTQEDDPAVARL